MSQVTTHGVRYSLDSAEFLSTLSSLEETSARGPSEGSAEVKSDRAGGDERVRPNGREDCFCG